MSTRQDISPLPLTKPMMAECWSRWVKEITVGAGHDFAKADDAEVTVKKSKRRWCRSGLLTTLNAKRPRTRADCGFKVRPSSQTGNRRWHGLDKRKTKKVVVYDFGGGTFDVSVLDIMAKKKEQSIRLNRPMATRIWAAKILTRKLSGLPMI